MIALDSEDVLELARVRNTYRLRMPDALALHTAIRSGSERASFDDALIDAAERAGVPVLA